ncbi:MAG: DUF29 domain-containing protein [Crocosphaera sp.]
MLMSITPITETIKYLYETDYDRWVLQTVQQLQDKNYEAIDWENLIDEVMDLSRRQRDKLMSLLTRLFEHLLKLAYWESERDYNYRGWNGEIQNFRIQIKRLLKKSPSLKVYLVEIFEESYQDARKITIKKTGLDSTIFPDKPIANLEQVLDDDWLPNIQ